MSIILLQRKPAPDAPMPAGTTDRLMGRDRGFLLTILALAGMLLFSLQQVTILHAAGSGVSLGTSAVLIFVLVTAVWMWARHGIPGGLRLPLAGLAAASAALALSVLASDRPATAFLFAARYASELALVWALVNLAWGFPGSGRAMARATIWFLLFVVTIGVGTYLGYDQAGSLSLYFHDQKALEFYLPRVSAIYEHPGVFSATGLMVALLALHLRLCRAVSAVELALAVLAAAVALVLAQTRNPLLSLFLLGLFFLFFGRRRGFRVPMRMWLAALVGMVGALAVMYLLRYKDMSDFKYFHGSLELVTSGRTELWSAAFRAWLDYPWLGTGPGVFEQLVPAYTGGHYAAGEFHAHNLFLAVLSETGLVGLFAGAWLAYALWTPLLRNAPSVRDRFLIAAWLVLLLSFGIADFYFHSYGFAMHCAVVVAFLYGEYAPRQERLPADCRSSPSSAGH